MYRQMLVYCVNHKESISRNTEAYQGTWRSNRKKKNQEIIRDDICKEDTAPLLNKN